MSMVSGSLFVVIVLSFSAVDRVAIIFDGWRQINTLVVYFSVVSKRIREWMQRCEELVDIVDEDLE